MLGKKRLLLWVVIMTFFMVSISGCAANDEKATKNSRAATQEPTLQQTAEILQEDVDGPGGMTPFGPERDPLFDFYNIPSDWPRAVPLMNDFQVTIYDWSEEGMYAAGYGNVSISRASNYYINAQKIHVSSNIWEQDPENPSVTEGPKQVFFYIGEGNTLSVALLENNDNSLYFELYFKPAPKE